MSNPSSVRVHPEGGSPKLASDLKMLSAEDSFQHEGGQKDQSDKKAKEPELTPEEKEAEKKRTEIARKKVSEILWSYVKKFKCLLVLGFVFNILGMVGEFASPLFIGLVIDSIVEEDQDQVVYLIILWMSINTVSR